MEPEAPRQVVGVSELVEFLRARLTEDETAARKAAGLCGCHPAAPSWSFRDGDEPTDGRILVVDEPHPTLKRKIGRKWNGSYEGLFMAEHIVRHDPVRVLAEVEAKKRLLELHPHTTMRQDLGEARLRTSYGPNWEKRLKRVDDMFCTTCHVEDGVIESSGQPCETLRLLSLPYANHPDYREEWKP